MKFVTGKTTKAISYQTIAEGGLNNQSVTVHGAVHALRDMGGITFLTLRMADGAIQCVCNPQVLSDGLCEECTVELSGLVRSESRAPGGWEIGVEKITVLSSPAAPMPVSLAKRKLDIRLDAELPLRPVVLRDLRRRAVFKLQEGLAQAFRDYLTREGFTEIHTPKIVSAGAEGGSNLFRLDYFGKKACLAQSPQIYKQTMVGAYERVFEVGPVFRAEKHATPRHLNEYTGLDLEMGYIRSFYDIMEVEVGFLAHAMNLLKTQYHRELALMDVKLPDASRIPCLRFDRGQAAGGGKIRIFHPGPLRPGTGGGSPHWSVRQRGAGQRLCVYYPLPDQEAALLRYGRSGRSNVYPVLRPAVPGAGGDHRRPAHPRLPPAGGQDEGQRHGSGGL